MKNLPGRKTVVVAIDGVAASCQLAGFGRRQARKLAACGYGPQTTSPRNYGFATNLPFHRASRRRPRYNGEGRSFVGIYAIVSPPQWDCRSFPRNPSLVRCGGVVIWGPFSENDSKRKAPKFAAYEIDATGLMQPPNGSRCRKKNAIWGLPYEGEAISCCVRSKAFCHSR